MSATARIFRGEEEEEEDDANDSASGNAAPLRQAFRRCEPPPPVRAAAPASASTSGSGEALIAVGIRSKVLPMVSDVSRRLSELLHNQQVQETAAC